MKQLYYIAFSVSENRTVYKIGITKYTVEERYKSCKTPFKVCWVLYTNDAEDVRSLEQLVIKNFRFERCEDAPVDGLSNKELFEVNVLPTAKEGVAFFSTEGIAATDVKPSVTQLPPSDVHLSDLSAHQDSNRAKDFARKYDLSVKEMAELLGVSTSLASRWLSETEISVLTTATVRSIENLDRMVQSSQQAFQEASRLKLRLSPLQLQVYEDWRNRQDIFGDAVKGLKMS
jgi:transcriptional regulator with XRE-family HTH domain